MSVARCQQEVDAVEFCRWRRFYDVEPYGQDWLQTALLCVILAAANGQRSDVEEWMPGAKRRQSAEEQQFLFRLAAAAKK